MPSFRTRDIRKKEGTTLSTIEIGGIRDAHELIGLKPSGITPLVFVPSKRSIQNLYVRIPDGFFALATKFGKNIGVLPSGGHFLMPGTRVAFLVTNRSNVFRAPIKNCKTKDNVDVSIEVLLVFKVTNAELFMYNLGPEKLDELLRAGQEEFVRTLARKTELTEVYSLQGMETDDMLAEMNASFVNEYGVLIEQITITQVRLDPELAQTLQKRAVFGIKQLEEAMKQKFSMNILNHKEDLSKQQNRSNEKLKQLEKECDQQVAECDREIAEVRADTAAKVAIVHAETEAIVNKIKIDAEMVAATDDAERVSKVNDINTKSAYRVSELNYEADTIKRTKVAEAEQIIAEARAKVTVIKATAQRDAGDALDAVRETELAKADIGILRGLGHNKALSVSGAPAAYLAMSAAATNGNLVLHQH